MFMESIHQLIPKYYDKAWSHSYDSDILSEVQDHDNYLDSIGKYHGVHEMQNDLQPNYVVDSDAEYMSDSNMIPYEQYVKDNAIFWSDDILKEKAKALKEKVNDPKPITAVMVYPPNTPTKLVPRVLPTKSQVKINIFALIHLFLEFDKTCKKRITPTGLTEGERGFEQTKECYLTEVIPFFKTLKKHFEGIQKALIKEVKEMKEIFEELEAEVDQNVVDRKCDEIERKNLLIANENLIVDCLSKDVFYTATNSVLTVSRFSEMHNAYTVEQARCLELEAEISKLKHKIKKDDHSEMIKRFSNLEGLRLLDHRINRKSHRSSRTNKIFRAENATIKQHHKELYDSIKIMRAKTVEKTTALLAENENLKAQIIEKMKCVIMDSVKPKVFAPGMYAIDVEPILPRNRNNREVHLDYLKHLMESVETFREIGKEARVEKPLDSSLASACLYTKQSQELVEYVIGTCLKDFNKKDKKIATTPLTRKKQVTFKETSATSNDNTQKHVKPQNKQKTNVPVIPSTGVISSTEASGSKPKRNTKNNRILPAKSDNKKKVEDHPRNNKSNLKQNNRVDSSISFKRRTDRPLVLGFRLLKTYDGESLTAHKFCEKFTGTGRFGNDHFGAIMGYGDYVIGDSVISKVYYMEGLGHNLFFVGQFCDSNLEVAFRKYSCYVRNEDGVDLLKGSHSSNMYTIYVEDMMKSSPICLLFKASKNKSWLWHRQLNHLNFGIINDLARKDLFLRSKDETLEFVIKFLKQIQVGLNKTVRYIHTNNGTEFVNQVLTEYYENVSIFHQKSVPRTPQQNNVVERQNQTLMEAAQTMLIFSKALLFLWAEAVATACYTQNRSLIDTHHIKTPYELMHDKKPDLKFL
ncbi:integrase, catalytic region, zinc finger, CCHC-type containing protein [Tanacetum coccineum]